MKHLDKVFKDKLFNREVDVPGEMWDKIELAVHEDSGRSALWFWLTGLLVLLLGGLTYLYVNSSNLSNTDSGPLAEVQNEIQTLSNIEDLVSVSNLDAKKEQDLQSIIPSSAATTSTTTSVEMTASFKPKNVSTPANSTLQQSKETKSISYRIANEAPAVQYGKPANLVITKSYVGEDGSYVKKSNVSTAIGANPSYSVFINSEGLNTRSFLRIIEPLDNIPLPAFEHGLKKKTPNSNI